MFVRYEIEWIYYFENVDRMQKCLISKVNIFLNGNKIVVFFPSFCKNSKVTILFKYIDVNFLEHTETLLWL